MRENIWSKRIPTLLGIFLIAIGIGITSYLVKTGTTLTSIAGPSETPESIRISNISSASFTVSYETERNVIGSINFGKDKNLGQGALDDRDRQRPLKEYKIHYMTVKNLEPSTNYYFSITSGSKDFLQKEEPFVVKTAPSIKDSVSLEKKIRGKVILLNGDSPKEAVVYLTSDNSQTISALLMDGSYSLFLNSLKTEDLTSYFTISDETIFRILVLGENSLVSNIKFSGLETKEIPAITLGNDYDFTQSNLETASESASTGFSSLSSQVSSSGKTPKIDIPKNNQTFIDSQPKFSGTALPNNTVEITIRSLENIKAQVVTDVYGNWTFRPTTSLSPGAHTITIVTRDVSGILRTVTASFTVFASGTQVAESATPSATPVVTQTPSPTPVPTVIPTTPISPTIPPIATITPIVSPTSPPGNSSAIILGMLGIGLSVIGFSIFLLSRGASSL